jgi:hypothetical protein
VSVSKKSRFEVFKRDKFTCQYCGAKAPDVLLHVDHIEPKSKGGKNDITNLITACVDCNGGKSDRRLSDDSVVVKQRDQLAELEERRQQLEMMLDWQRSLSSLGDETIDKLQEFWCDLVHWMWSDVGRERIKKLVRRHGSAAVAEAIRIAAEQYVVFDATGNGTQESVALAFSKIGGICSMRAAAKEKPYLQDLLYIRGIVRNRCSYFKPHEALDLLEVAYSWGESVEDLKQIARSANTWTRWTDAMREYIDEKESE